MAGMSTYNVKNAVEQGGIYLGENALKTLHGLLDKQQQQAMTLSADTVIALLQRVRRRHFEPYRYATG